MIDCLVFSKDRPAQLDLLLRSARRHAGHLYGRLTLLYTISSADYLRGYQRVYAEHPHVRFELEHDFEGQTREWLRRAGELVSFLVDDDVFYRDAPPFLGPLPFSLRGGDYDYPFSVDGNVYRRGDVERLLEGLRFRDPTELEAFAHNARARLPFVEVHASRPPCLVGVPANRVSVSSGMPHMGVDPRELCTFYLAGGRLELELDDEPVDLPAHAELHYRRVAA